MADNVARRAPAGDQFTIRGVPPRRVRIARMVVIAVLLQAMFVFFFVFPGHDPKPNGVPVGVVGAPPAAQAFAGRLDGFDVTRYASEAGARQAIEDRDIYGAFVLGPRGPERLLTAPAASFTVATALQEIGRAAGVRRVQAVVPLDPDDARGTTLNLLVLPIVVTSILAGLVASQLVPDLRLPLRMVVLLGAGVAAGVVDMLIVNAGIGALPGSLVAEALLVALAFMGLALVTAGFIRLVGPLGTFAGFALFLMIGNPAAGLATAPELLPSPWKEVGPVLPPGAVGSALRNVAYFDGVKLLGPLVVLAVWVAVGVVLHALADRKAAP
jgi:hypothetical protein